VVERPDAAEIVLAKLRGMIAAGTQENDTILGTIAVAAHALTGATGAAIAMPRDGVVLCVGRSGETAPELGAPLNVDSGISGECLRTGRILRCDDAGRDYQVDPEVCRQLGLRLSRSEEETRLDFALKLTFYTMELLATGRHRVPL